MYLLHVNPITSAKWDGSKIHQDTDSGEVPNHHAGDDEEANKVDRVPTKTVEE